MSEKRPRRAHAPIWGIVLLFLGIVFLLQVLDILPWGLWGTLWRFWPVLIIIIGLGILLRRSNALIVSLFMFALLWACLGIAYWQYSPPSGSLANTYSESRSGLEQASISINFDGGSLSVGSLPLGSPNLVGVNSNSGGRGIEANFHRQNNEANLHLSATGINRIFFAGPWNKWEAELTGDIPLTLDISSSAGSMSVDLSELQVTEAIVKSNVGECKVTTPSSPGTAVIEIEANVSNVEVTIPDGVAARIHLDTEVTIVDIDQNRFSQNGDYFMSPDFGTNEKQVDLSIKCNVGRVQVK